ncbi:MAG: hypothetical protein JRN52_13635 [Nitrososphaerota archaeon]|nr:hypothetical protein [Nitrososphaerota archaeon]
MFDKKNKDNVCFCDSCEHKTASECIELDCLCCVKADKIRMDHPVIPEEDLSPEEKQRRQQEQLDEERAEEKTEEIARTGNLLPW